MSEKEEKQKDQREEVGQESKNVKKTGQRSNALVFFFQELCSFSQYEVDLKYQEHVRLYSKFDLQTIVFKSKVLHCGTYNNLNYNSNFITEILGCLTLLIVKAHGHLIILIIYIEICISNFLKSQSFFVVRILPPTPTFSSHFKKSID